MYSYSDRLVDRSLMWINLENTTYTCCAILDPMIKVYIRYARGCRLRTLDAAENFAVDEGLFRRCAWDSFYTHFRFVSPCS